MSPTMKHTIQIAPGVTVGTNRDDLDISGWADLLTGYDAPEGFSTVGVCHCGKTGLFLGKTASTSIDGAWYCDEHAPPWDGVMPF
jgi:hypothetical protein